MIDKLLNSNIGKIIISILWGLGLACIFRKVCVGRKCIVYKSPLPEKIVSNIYLHDGKCYKYLSKTTKCVSEAIE